MNASDFEFEGLSAKELMYDPDLQEKVTNELELYLSLMSDEVSDFVNPLIELTELSGFTMSHEKFQYYAWLEILMTLISLRRQYKIEKKRVTKTIESWELKER